MSLSLKKRLTASVITIFIVSWLLSAVLTTVAARLVMLKEVDRMLGGMLQVTESVGRPFLAGELTQLQQMFSDNMVTLDGSRRLAGGTLEQPEIVRLDESLMVGPLGMPSVNVWVSDIHLLIGRDTPAFAPPSTITEGKAMTQTIAGEDWRVMYRFDADNRVWYATGLARKQAQFDGSQLLLQMLLPLAVIIPLTILALYFGINRGLNPLRLLARDIERRRSDQSLSPLPIAEVPEELAPVVDSLNHLLERLADTLENEQRFTANAAHELQTPLAAITTEVQLCQRLVNDEESRAMMERIYARVQRASHSVRQLLVLARLDPHAALQSERLALCELLQDVVSELGHLASEGSIGLDFNVDEKQEIVGNREALLILFRNLINNAFRYTPAGGMVRIYSGVDCLFIENNSEPIPEPARLLDRFYRGENSRSAAEAGTGLGLSIVSRICELHSMTLSLSYSESESSFTVRITFPQS